MITDVCASLMNVAKTHSLSNIYEWGFKPYVFFAYPQLMKAEERLQNLEQCECLRYCYDNGTQRREGEEWKKDKCNMCRCKVS